MIQQNIYSADFMKVVKDMKAKYNNALIIYKNTLDNEATYEVYLEDAEFFIKYLGLHRISSDKELCWAAFPEGMLKSLIIKITKVYKLIIVEPVDLKESGFQLSLNFL